MKIFFFIPALFIFANCFSQNNQLKDTITSNVFGWNKLEAIKEDTPVRRQVLNGKTFALENFELHATTLEQGQAPHPPHTHADQDELMIIKEGQVKITIGGKNKILGPGSIAFAMAGDEHGIENAGNTKAIYYVLKYKSRKPDMERAKLSGGSFMIDVNDLKANNTGKGYRKDYFNRATSQIAQIEMHTTALNADSVSHAPHTHIQEEILIILRGNVTMHIDGKLVSASPGDVVFLSSLVPHALLNTGKEQCEYFAFQWRN